MGRIIRIISRFFLILTCTLFMSCTIWSTSQWKSLQDREFHLTRFVVYNKGSNRTSAYRVMRSFPVKQVMTVLSSKYNITINISSFTKFVNEGKAGNLEVFGVLTSDRFTWKDTREKNNVIEIEYDMQGKETFDGMVPGYTINMKTDGKLRAVHSDTVTSESEVPASLVAMLFGSKEKYTAISGKEGTIINNTSERPSAQIDTSQLGIFFDSRENLEKARQLLEKEFQVKTDQ
ncbi:MAG: hypothetical protein ACOCX9_00815 [Spirochaetota bacterium]